MTLASGVLALGLLASASMIAFAIIAVWAEGYAVVLAVLPAVSSLSAAGGLVRLLFPGK